MLACSSSASLAAARAGGAAGSLSRQSQAALRAPSSRAQRALGRRLLQCRAEEGNGNGNGNHGNGNGNGNGQGESNGSAISQLAKAADKAGLSMGPISLTFGAPIEASPIQMTLGGSAAPEREFVDEDPAKPVVRLNPLSTEEWQKKFVNEGAFAFSLPRFRSLCSSSRLCCHQMPSMERMTSCLDTACFLYLGACDSSPSVLNCGRDISSRVSLLQTAPSICGWRRSSTQLRACQRVARTGARRTWHGLARRPRTPTSQSIA